MKFKISEIGILCRSCCALGLILASSIFAQSTTNSTSNFTQVPVLGFNQVLQILNGSSPSSLRSTAPPPLPTSTLALLTPSYPPSTTEQPVTTPAPSSTSPQTSPTITSTSSTPSPTTIASESLPTTTTGSVVIEYFSVQEDEDVAATEITTPGTTFPVPGILRENLTEEAQPTTPVTTFPAPEALRESPTPSTTTTEKTTTTTTPKPIILSNKVIKIAPGELRPAVERSRGGRKYYAFRGIPYANPPNFFQRFKEPAPVTPWSGIINASTYGPSCIQYNVLTSKVEGEEDCLTLNIFTPRVQEQRRKKGSKLFPVIVFFHQGAFSFGTSGDFQEKYLMDEDIVLVTVNYRLGAFGFLNTEGDSDARGNMGLKDQVLALKFVRDNIHHFNGEPNLVTIAGESAGGSSVHYHLLSNGGGSAKGLFSRAISMSGTALSPWAFTRSPRRNAKKLGTLLNCPTTDMNELFQCLHGQDARVIAEKTKDLYEWNIDPVTPFGPTVEKEETLSSFMTQTPYSLMKSGQINTDTPWMLGVVEDICLLDAWSILVDPGLVEDMNVDWHRVAPVAFWYKDTALEPDAVSNQIKAYYFGTEEVGNSTAKALSNLYSDRYFNHGIRQSALLHVRNNEAIPVYLYMFSYRGSQSHTKFAGVSENLGVSEGDDLQYLFNTDRFDETAHGSKDEDISKKFVKLWVSFARDGKPTATWGSQEWKPISPDEVKEEALRYYSLNDTCGYIEEPYSARLNFWDNLPLNENERELLGTYQNFNPGNDEIFNTFNNKHFN